MPLPQRLCSLPLVSLLQEWVPVAAEPPGRDVPERLGEWLNAMGSVKLDGALQAIEAYGAQRAARRPQGVAVDASALHALCRDARSDLVAVIDRRLDALAATPEAAYSPYHQHYLALQKQMEAKLAACRVLLRQALSKGPTRLRQLAALDGVMAELLGEREHKLLAALPVYLERRFTHWHQVAQQAPVGTAKPDEGFLQDMRRMLLAELHWRLQALLGLIEAADLDTAAAHTDHRSLDTHSA